MLLGCLLEFKFIKIYKMLKSFTPVDEGIHDSFIVNLECLSYDHDQLLKDSLDAICYRELYNSIGGFMEKSANCFIRFKALNCSQDVVLKYRNGDAGNLGCKITGLGFPQAKKALGLLEKYFDGPSH